MIASECGAKHSECCLYVWVDYYTSDREAVAHSLSHCHDVGADIIVLMCKESSSSSVA